MQKSNKRLKSLSNGKMKEKRKNIRNYKDTGDMRLLEQEIKENQDIAIKVNREIL